MIKRLMAAVMLMSGVLALSAAPVSAEEFKVGEDYELVNPVVPAAGNGKVEVVELFWYGCPHCYQFEPVLHDWLENKPANVEFVRIPAIFNNPRWRLHAKAYYTAEVLDVLDKFHKPFFDAMHKDRLRMGSKEEIRAFFDRIDVDAKTFDNTFDSFAVETKVRRAADLTRKYGIDGVPSIIVAGKYRSDGPMAKTYPRLMEIVDALVVREAM